MIKLLMFDLDGTLVDSAPDIVTSANLLLNEIGRESLPAETIIAAIGHGIGKLVYQLIPETKDDPDYLKSLAQRFAAIYEKNLVVKTTVMPGLRAYLKSMAADRKLAVVTNKSELLALKIIEQTPLSEFPWAAIIGGKPPRPPKPDPQPLLEAISIAGVRKEEAVIIGDGLPDIVAARRAGIRSIGIEFGYTEPNLLKAEGATRMISSYEDLPRAIEELESLQCREP